MTRRRTAPGAEPNYLLVAYAEPHRDRQTALAEYRRRWDEWHRASCSIRRCTTHIDAISRIRAEQAAR